MKNTLRKKLIFAQKLIRGCFSTPAMRLAIFIISCVAFLQSCNNSNKPDFPGYTQFSEQDFRSSGKLFGSKIANIKLENPRNISVIDSLIVIVNRNTDYLLHVYSIKTGKRVNELIRKGKGPHELLSTDYIQKQNKEKKILVFGTVEKKVIEFSFDDLLKKSSEIAYTEFSINDQGCLRVVKSGENYIGLTLADSIVKRLYVYNSKGAMIDAIGDYPSVVPKVGNMLDAVLFEAYHKILSDGTIALSYSNMDLIELYDSQYRLQKRLWGPNGVLPSYQLKSKGTYKWVGFKEDQICTYGDIIPDPMNNEFWVSYSGRKLNDNGYLWSKIFVLETSGVFLKRYELDIPMLNMDVDFKSKKIYAITYPELAVYEFKY
ncbi:MAG: BF3164 family lipoprotein [Mangrovibacterium sp.]